MPLTLPDLDDRGFDDLVAEALALIPSLAPAWTDHNPTDPGITLVELFAYLSEALIYRLNRVTDANTLAFLKLLNGPAWQPSADLAADVRGTVQSLRRTDRAVTPQDFEALARAASPQVARCVCVPRRDLAQDALADAPGHVSVVVLAAPAAGSANDATKDATKDATAPALLDSVAQYLSPRRLLTTRVHVVPPRWVTLGVNLLLVLEADALPDVVLAGAKAALLTFLHPLTGGSDGQGWPFGRPVYVSEIYRLLDGVPGVDYVEGDANALRCEADPQRQILTEDQHLIGIRLAPDELVDPALDLSHLIAAAQKRR